MFRSIKFDVVSVFVSVLFVISSSIVLVSGVYNENDICTTNPHSECRRLTGCPSAIEDIVSGRHLKICCFGDDEPIVCCRLHWIRRVQFDAFGMPWNSGHRLFLHPYRSWNTFRNSQEQPWYSPVHQPTVTRRSPPSVTKTQQRTLSSSVYYPSDTRDPSWSSPRIGPSNTQKQPSNSSECQLTNTRNQSWTPFQHVTYGTQLPLRIPTKLEDTKFTGNLPTTPPPPRSKQFSQPKITTQQTLSAYTTPPPIPGINNTISVQKCQEYGQLCSMVRDYVAGGFLAGPSEFPHMALIGFGLKNKKIWHCGGSVISKRYILSAAHCTYPGKNKGYAKWVRLGDLDYTTQLDGAQPRDYTIIERINHPGYISPQLYNDIALYKVNKEIPFTDYIQPVCLHTSFEISEKVGKAAGWGRTEFVGPTSSHLLYTNISFVSSEKCKDNLDYRLSKHTFPDGVIANSIICAGEDNGNHDTCQGDSGGPLFIAQKDPWPQCLYRQVGITSTGLPCTQENSPGLYTRVSNYIDWIESIVWSNDP